MMISATDTETEGLNSQRRLQMESWDLKTVEVEPHQPRILASADDARTILLHLPEGEELQEHEVHERARVLVVDGDVDVAEADGDTAAAGAGHLFEFEPGERRTIVARSDARLLMVLSPWPGDGHPGAMSLEEKAQAREKAAEHTAQ
jgi:quercetin dioxygenase-like cupin family protein